MYVGRKRNEGGSVYVTSRFLVPCLVFCTAYEDEFRRKGLYLGLALAVFATVEHISRTALTSSGFATITKKHLAGRGIQEPTRQARLATRVGDVEAAYSCELQAPVISGCGCRAYHPVYRDFCAVDGDVETTKRNNDLPSCSLYKHHVIRLCIE